MVPPRLSRPALTRAHPRISRPALAGAGRGWCQQPGGSTTRGLGRCQVVQVALASSHSFAVQGAVLTGSGSVRTRTPSYSHRSCPGCRAWPPTSDLSSWLHQAGSSSNSSSRGRTARSRGSYDRRHSRGRTAIHSSRRYGHSRSMGQAATHSSCINSQCWYLQSVGGHCYSHRRELRHTATLS